MSYFYYIISMIALALCLLTPSVIVVKRFNALWNSKERIIILLLLTVILFESVATFILWKYWISTSRIYDVLSFISIILIIWWFQLYLKMKWLTVVSVVLVLTANILDLTYYSGLKTEFPLKSIAQAIVVISSVFLLLKMLLLSDLGSDLKKIRPFWISIGLLTYQITDMALILFLPKLTRLDWEPNFVITVMNILLYGCIAYAFSLRKENE